ncbi:MAG: hypothetical protein JW712_09265 [Dehalococcoidales bacterium]|nr:hypothetical protein [Dehalococcoidales bacterium]
MIEQTIDLVGFGGGKETLVQESVALLDLPLPEVITCQATNIGFTSATINGLLEDDGEVICDCTFEWGLTDTYGNVTLSWNKTAGEFFTEILTGLLPDTVYHFRTVSWNGFGISYGLDRIFRTLTSVEETYFQRLLFFLLTEDE